MGSVPIFSDVAVTFALFKQTLREHWYALERSRFRYRSVETEHKVVGSENIYLLVRLKCR